MIISRRVRSFAALLACAVACGGLATSGSLAAAVPPQPEGLDHFKCYRAAADTKDPFEKLTNVTLTDQFGKEKVKVAKFPDRLCNPVEKTLRSGETFPPRNPDAHLVCWPISAEKLSPIFEVKVSNQFGDAGLTVSQRQRLCVPSWKVLKGQPLPDPTQPSGLDHFKCYAATYSSKQQNTFEALPPSVTLKDQFESVSAKVGKPTELCNPVEKRRNDNGEVTPITNRDAHLVCFTISEKPHANPPLVSVKNQFGIGTLDPGPEQVLCLPSFKSIVVAPTSA